VQLKRCALIATALICIKALSLRLRYWAGNKPDTGAIRQTLSEQFISRTRSAKLSGANHRWREVRVT
jgi:hypothetical protein